MLAKTQFPDVNILRLAFFGPLLVPSRGRLVVLFPINSAASGDVDQLYFYGDFQRPAVPYLPGTGSGNFIAFYAVFMGLF